MGMTNNRDEPQIMMLSQRNQRESTPDANRSIETESRSVVAWGWGGEVEGALQTL